MKYDSDVLRTIVRILESIEVSIASLIVDTKERIDDCDEEVFSKE